MEILDLQDLRVKLDLQDHKARIPRFQDLRVHRVRLALRAILDLRAHKVLTLQSQALRVHKVRLDLQDLRVKLDLQDRRALGLRTYQNYLT
jgi:hypothetical protein